MMSFSDDSGNYSSLLNKIDMPLYNSFFNNTPLETKFSIGSFNYNPVTTTSFSFFPAKNAGASK